MKKFVLIIVVLMLSIGVKAQTKTVEIQTSAVCIMCKNTIERDMAYEKGVKSSDLDLETKVLTVEYNAKKTDPDKIRTRITQIGYHADDKKRDPKAYANLPECCQDGGHAEDEQ